MVVIKSLAAVAALSLVNSAQAWYHDLPPCLTPFDPFVYTGCYDNGQPGQKEALSLRTDLDSQNMTVETCVAECKGNNYRLAGLSYYGVCYCGQTVSTALLGEDQCSFPCTGNSSETCGGDTQINIWMDPTFPPLADQTDVSEYVAVGCWTDDASDGKALFYRQDTLASSSMTTETCLQACLSGGFPFAGTEYGGECYCGVVVGNGTALAADSSTCNVPCNGNPDQICGGPARLSLYVAKDLQSLEPCGTPPDTSSSSTISSSTTTSSSSTTTSSTTTSSTSISTPPITSSTTTTTTKSSTTTTTTSATVCTTTIVTPPTCEYHCGKWCSNPIPDWDDNHSCLTAWSQCLIQTSSCFLQAGWPDSLKCFEFGDWCASVKSYCGNKCPGGKCGKADCYSTSPPHWTTPPVTRTTTIPCPTTVTTKTTSKTTSKPTSKTTSTSKGGYPTTSKGGYPTTTKGGYPTSKPTSTKTTATGYPTSSCPVPTPTGICIQPSSSKWGYGPGNPVGGIALPVVTCNNIQADWKYYPFKMYNNKDSRQCPGYTRPDCNTACSDACWSQYLQCDAVYAQGCKTYSTGRFIQSGANAEAACDAQYHDCIAVNAGVDGKGKCTTWGDSC